MTYRAPGNQPPSAAAPTDRPRRWALQILSVGDEGPESARTAHVGISSCRLLADCCEWALESIAVSVAPIDTITSFCAKFAVAAQALRGFRKRGARCMP